MSSTTINPATATLVVIDVQQGFSHPTHWGTARSNPAFEANLERVLKLFRSEPSAKIIHVAHRSTSAASPIHPSKPGVEFMSYATPIEGEAVISKNVNSAFIGTELEKMLRETGCKTLVIAGLSTDHCVSTTTRMAANLHVCGEGGRVVLVGDATAAYAKGGFDAETVHAVNLASLNGEFAEIVKTEDLEKMLGNREV